MTIKKRKFT